MRRAEELLSETITIEIWLYGPIRSYADEVSDDVVLDRTVGSAHAELHVELPKGSTVQDLLDHLNLPSEENSTVMTVAGSTAIRLTISPVT